MRRSFLSLMAGLAAFGCGTDGPTSLEGPATLRVVLTSTGLDLPFRGPEVLLDGRLRTLVGPNDTVVFGVPTGATTVTLQGFPANCTAVGSGYSQVVRPVAGDTVTAAFAVSCVAVHAVVLVQAATAGPDPDTDGYLVTLDGSGPALGLSINGTAVFPTVMAGTHSLAVAAVDPHCAVTGPNPVTGITVSTGGATRDTARVTVAVACAVLRGVVRVQATTTGTGLDADGYQVRVGATAAGTLGPNGATVSGRLLGGDYLVAIQGLAPNCVLRSVQPVIAVVVPGDTTQVQVSVRCDPPTRLRITAPTTGPNADPGYQVYLNGAGGVSLRAADTLLVDVVPGAHLVTLGDLNFNCTASGGLDRLVTAAVGTVVDVTFPVACTAVSGTTGIVLTTTTGAGASDTTYTVAVCPAFNCFGGITAFLTIAGSEVRTVPLPPGSYYLVVGSVDPGCEAQWAPGSSSFGLVAGQLLPVGLRVNCNPAGTLAVSAVVSGAGPDSSFYVQVDGGFAGNLVTPGNPVLVTAAAGPYSVTLGGVDANCTVAGGATQPATIVGGLTTTLAFVVNCQARPTLTLNVVASGTNIPATFVVGVDLDSYSYYDWGNRVVAPANGQATAAVVPGAHLVALADLPGNCVVQGLGGAQYVYVPVGQDVPVSFTVACQ